MNKAKTNAYLQTEAQSPAEKFSAIETLTSEIEDNFITLGDVLTQVKRLKLYRFKGYESFRDYIESEYNFSSSLASKITSIYELFVEELAQDAVTMTEIGFERLSIILPLMRKAEWKEREKWMKVAAEFPVKDLKAAVKAHREKAKDSQTDLKSIFVEQYLENMLTWFNCSGKELQFKLALFFAGRDMAEVKQVVKERQRQFETEISHAE